VTAQPDATAEANCSSGALSAYEPRMGQLLGNGGSSVVKAWGGLSDDELLAEMVKAHAAHANVDRGVAQHVAALRARGVSWARIGEALAMTRQSAWERFSGDE